MTTKTLTERLHVVVSKATMKALKTEAKRTGESLGRIVRRALANAVDGCAQ
jgi:predicted HicB family RNase H-like nuclease